MGAGAASTLFAGGWNSIPTPDATLVASFTVTPTRPQIGETATYRGSATGGTPPYKYWNWTFLDTGDARSGQNVTYAFASAGTKNVRLTVTDSNLPTYVSDPVTNSVTVTAVLVTNITFNPAKPQAGQSVSFTANPTGGTGGYTHSWTWDDGTSGSTGATPSHTFATQGTFTVVLTTTDTMSHTATDSRPVTVTAGLATDFTFAPAKPQAGESITFTASPSGGTGPYTHSWAWDDGTPGSTGPTPSHTYAASGSFTVMLTTTDAVAHTATRSRSVVVTAALTASFTFTPAQPAVGQSVSFSGSASGGTTPYTFSWAWGDGTPNGAGQSPTHTFAAAGTFTVVLTVTDGATPVHTAPPASRPVPVIAGLVADFTFTPTKPQAGESIAFTATASGGTIPYTFSWTWGDGTPNGAGQSPTHTFAAAGTYLVTLRVTDSATPSPRVVNVPPKSVLVTPVLAGNFTFTPTAPSAGDVVSFQGTATGGTGPYQFLWTFGDGGTGTGATVTHVFATAGTYTVTLTVSDSAGHVPPTVSKFVSVGGALGADFTFVPVQPVIGEVASFSATAAGGNPPYTYSWTWDDGTPAGTGRDVTHAYATARTFTVTLRVNDAASHVAIVSKSVIVTPRVTANFTFTPPDPVVGEEVTFNATATGGTSPYTYEWTFGDLSSDGGLSVRHTYEAQGNFTVRLTLADSIGHVANATKIVVVRASLTVNLTVSRDRPVIGESITFTASASGASPPYTYSWSFGDGLTAAGANVFHAFASEGGFLVNVTATDVAGRRGVASREIVVTRGIAADFTFTPVSPLAGQTVFFRGTNPIGGTGPYLFRWTFGDASTGTGKNVSHVYVLPGTYGVNLTVTDSAGHGTVVSKPVRVSTTLAAVITYSPSNPIVGERITFSANVTGGMPPWRNFTWAFGDGARGTDSGTVIHFYTSVGAFNVTLTASDALGRPVTARRTVNTTAPVAADFTVQPAMPVTGRPMSFSPIASGGTPPYMYEWTFGDGIASKEMQPTHTYSSSDFSVTYQVVLVACDSAGHCTSVSKAVTIVDWQQVVNVGGATAVVAILGLWFVRRFFWRSRA